MPNKLREQLSDLGWVLVVALAIDLLISWPLMLAWNCVIPVLTPLPEIGYWQAFSLLFIAAVVRATIKGSN